MFSLVFSDETGSIPCGQMKTILKVVKAQPLAQPEIIHCRDCKHCYGSVCDNFAVSWVNQNDFCSRAERREDDHETN